MLGMKMRRFHAEALHFPAQFVLQTEYALKWTENDFPFCKSRHGSDCKVVNGRPKWYSVSLAFVWSRPLVRVPIGVVK